MSDLVIPGAGVSVTFGEGTYVDGPIDGVGGRVIDPRHSAESSEWYTPPAIVAAARDALGGIIDLDPATCERANSEIVGAGVYYDGNNADGLIAEWFGKVFCNPPTPPAKWWQRTVHSVIRGEAEAAVYVAYSIEALQQSMRWTPGNSMLSFPLCVPRSRVRYFTRADELAVMLEKRAAKLDKLARTKAQSSELRRMLKRIDELLAAPEKLVEGPAPTHASAIVGVGIDARVFAEAFASIGECSLPAFVSRADRMAAHVAALPEHKPKAKRAKRAA